MNSVHRHKLSSCTLLTYVHEEKKIVNQNEAQMKGNGRGILKYGVEDNLVNLSFSKPKRRCNLELWLQETDAIGLRPIMKHVV
jgi:hypothetical protein